MSYNKRTWATGNVVGAVDLNRMEDRIANIDVGYSCSEEWVTLTDESVTTAIEGNNSFAGVKLAYSEPITADTINVTFNGTECTCNKQTNYFGFDYYGADIGVPLGASVDWSEYPFSVSATPVGNVLGTETAGTYQIKIETLEETIETSECFDKARGYSCIDTTTVLTNETITSVDVGWKGGW